MQISRDTVVSFHYQMFEHESLLESSPEGEPGVLYLHGRGAIPMGLEEAMEGRQSGDNFEVTLPPEKAYGPRRELPLERVPLKYVLTKGRIRPGDVVQVSTRNGPREAVARKVGRFNLDVDTNHPLAGRTLRFVVQVDAVREATKEEIAHGHAHGAGGHQH
jgi:FKBP-type peptidyl-prolyl cis-trans isomerase SlyD